MLERKEVKTNNPREDTGSIFGRKSVQMWNEESVNWEELVQEIFPKQNEKHWICWEASGRSRRRFWNRGKGNERGCVNNR